MPERKIPHGQEQERMNTANDTFPDAKGQHVSMQSSTETEDVKASIEEAVRREKLNWYREVLDIEPGSKVFLPFARMLVAQGLSREAVKILRRGLEFHPEFIEARLLLIDVLHKNGSPAECGAEVARLAALFREYPGFWDAWSELSAAEGAASDLSASLGLLGALLRDSRVTLAEVISAGLRAMQRSGSCGEPGELPSGRESGSPQTVSGTDASSSAETRSEQKVQNTQNEEPEEPAAPGAGASPSEREERSETENAAGISSEVSAAEGQSPAGTSSAGGPELAALREAAQELDAFRNSSAEVSEAGTENSSASEEQIREKLPSEGKCSLRTRSMAEILAEQGDLRGAMDIYEELAQTALPEDLPAIYRRLDSLRAAAGGASAHSGAAVPAPSPVAPLSSAGSSHAAVSSSQNMPLAVPARAVDASSSRGVLDMLEKLAVRLENRAS